jgi:hypothetical protein
MDATTVRGARSWIATLATVTAVALTTAPAWAATATGDFDNNGVEDLAIGVPGEDVGLAKNAGAVDVFYGQTAGIQKAGNDHWTQNRTGIREAADAGDRFGSSLATADFDGDGFDDLAIGVPLEDLGPSPIANAGAVAVLHGSASGLTASGNDFLFSDPEAGDRFGTAVAADDMFGGLEADLAVGAPAENGNIGRVSRFLGPGLQEFGIVLDGLAAGDMAGSALATGQFGRRGSGLPGKADLAVGLPGASSGAGRIDVYYFGDIGSAFRQGLNQANLGRTVEAGDHFGAALAAGDFGDGSFDDLAVGAPEEDIEASSASNAGIVGVFYSRSGSLSVTGTDVWDQANAGLGMIETGDRFGAALATGNFGNSSTGDLAAGMPGEDIGSGPSVQVDAGAVGFLYGDSVNGLSNVNADTRVPQPNFNYGPPEGGMLGSSLGAGNFGSGMRDDVAAGIPLFPQFSDPEASATGLVGVLYGRAGGIAEGVTAPDLTLLDQIQLTGLGDDREGGDVFGASLAPSAGRSIVTLP